MGTKAKRFYFDIELDGEITQDNEGVEARGLEQALADARSVVHEMAGQLDNACLGADSVLIVRDEAGATVGRIYFEDVQERVAVASCARSPRRRNSAD